MTAHKREGRPFDHVVSDIEGRLASMNVPEVRVARRPVVALIPTGDELVEPGERVLDYFDLCIEPGEDVAFVGHTGAGKSTIAKLINRTYDIDAGCVLVDE